MTNEWDAAASEYEASWEKTTGYTVARLVDWLAPRDGSTIADVACGPGTVTVALLARGAGVRASDFSAAMLDTLRARVGSDAPVETDVADAAALPYADDSCDGAVSNFGVIFCPEYETAMHELARITRPGGRLAMTAWSSEDRNGWTTLLAPDHEQVLGFALPERPACRWRSVDAFRAALERAGCQDIDIETIDFPSPTHPTPEDVRHAIESPASRIALASLTDAQRSALGDYLVARARTRFGDGEVPLPRQAWLARAYA